MDKYLDKYLSKSGISTKRDFINVRIRPVFLYNFSLQIVTNGVVVRLIF